MTHAKQYADLLKRLRSHPPRTIRGGWKPERPEEAKRKIDALGPSERVRAMYGQGKAE